MNLTWGELRDYLNKMADLHPNQLKEDVTVFDDNEGVFVHVRRIGEADEGILDLEEGFPFLEGGNY